MIAELFSDNHRAAWHHFLQSEAGRLGLAYVREANRPAINDSHEPHAQSLALGKQAGFDLGLQAVEGLGLKTLKAPVDTSVPLPLAEMAATRPSRG